MRAHRRKPETARVVARGRIEALAVVGDPQAQAVAVRELYRDHLRLAVTMCISHSLADDPQQGFARMRRDGDIRIDEKARTGADAAGQLLHRFDDRGLEPPLSGPVE